MGVLFDEIRQHFDEIDDLILAGFNSQPPPDPGAPPGPGYGRALAICPPPNLITLPPGLTLVQARARMVVEITAYLDHPTDEILVLKYPPGSGKTWAAAAAAEDRAMRLKQFCLYAGPRHEFWWNIAGDPSKNLMGAAKNLSEWLHWLPHTRANPALNYPETCKFPDEIAAWAHRGWNPPVFCETNRKCGFSYMHAGCVWHEQARTSKKIWFGQHQHVTSGIPRAADMHYVIGDENPLGAFQHTWEIPENRIVPELFEHMQDDLADVLREFKRLAVTDQSVDGPTLLTALGGARKVYDAIKNYSGPVPLPPALSQPASALHAPYNHFWTLTRLLLAEAEAALAGHRFPHRVRIERHRLILPSRRDVNKNFRDKPIVWLNATADKALYERLFRRPVKIVDPRIPLQGKIYQVTSRSNNKTSMVKNAVEVTSKTEQLVCQVQEIAGRYRSDVGLITYKALRGYLEAQLPSNVRVGHFGGQRGTNEFEDCEAMIVAGTPQPSLDEIENIARQIWLGGPDAMKPFRDVNDKLPWTTIPTPYCFVDPTDGQGRQYPVGQFVESAPERLNTVLKQLREAEIVQAAHRARPIVHPVDIWLLTNIPIDELPPTELIELRHIFGAPEGVTPWLWPRLRRTADAHLRQSLALTAADVMGELGIDRRTAIRYLKLFALAEPAYWVPGNVLVERKQHGGRAGFALVPRLTAVQSASTNKESIYANVLWLSTAAVESRTA